MAIVVTPIPQLIELAAPAFTLGTANTAGSAITAVASDSTLLAFDTTLPAAVGSAAVGTAVVPPRRDHVHSGGYFKVGSFTKDTADATGTSAITGVGFAPKALIFFMNVSGQDEMSFGLADGSSSGMVADQNGQQADDYYSTTGRIIQAIQAGNVEYAGVLNSLDSDGFTIGWTKTGAKTGTMLIFYLAVG